MKKAKEDADRYALWLNNRYYWGDVLQEFHQVFIRVENETKGAMKTDTGVWIERFTTDTNLVLEPLAMASPGVSAGMPLPPGATGAGGTLPPGMGLPPGVGSGNGGNYPLGGEIRADIGVLTPDQINNKIRLQQQELARRNAGGTPGVAADAAPAAPATPAAARASKPGTNEVANISILCRAVILPKEDNNAEIALALERALKDDPMFDKDETQLAGSIDPIVEGSSTFTFGVRVKLKKPLKY